MTARLPALLAAALLLAIGSAASAQAARDQPYSEVPEPVVLSATPAAGRALSSERALAIASALPKMRAVLREHHGSFGDIYTKGAVRWQVSFFTAGGAKEIGLVVLSERGRVLEQWTGFQIAWTMARGYPGAFGEHVNALYIWLPLCALFLLPFLQYSRPLSLHNLDLLVLLSFSISLAFFNHAHIYASVPLAYPPLLYLLARMLWLARRRSSRPPREGHAVAGRLPRAPRLLVPAPWLAVGVVFLIGFRIGLNVSDSNVIDVGYAGVIGAQRIASGRPLYGHYPSDNEHGDTYGPVNYEAYVPFEQVFGWGGTWDDLPAAHAAAIFFDLLTVALLFLLGRRMRGPTLGVALAYAWVSYPFTLFALESNANDTLVAALVLAALLAASYSGGAAKRAGGTLAIGLRGVLAALASFTKFAPLALAPVLATHGLRELPASRPWLRVRMLVLYALCFAGASALAFVPALAHDSLHTIYERTLVYQANRNSPFSVWGLYGLHGAELAVEAAAVALAVALALLPRREGIAGLAAACAAILIAVELGMEHWFYLYIPWFFPLVMLALLGREGAPGGASGPAAGAASEPARSTLRAAALST